MSDSDVRTGGAATLRPTQARILRRSLALALGCLLALAGTEGGYRIWRWLHGDPYDGVRSQQRLHELVEQLKGLDFIPKSSTDTPVQSGLSLHPYEGFQQLWTWKDSHGSGDYFETPEGRANYDILLLGGSQAAMFGNFSEQLLLPLLEADPHLAGRKVKLHNRACQGHKQPQLANSLQWILSLGVRPDAVLLIDGFNELAVAAENAEGKVHPLFPSWWEMQAALSGPLANPGDLELVGKIVSIRQSAEQLAARARRSGLMRSAVLGSRVEREFEGLDFRAGTLLLELEKLAADRQEDRPLFVSGPAFANDPSSVQRLSLQAWMEGSRTMQAACRVRKIHFVHVLQPAARDKGSKTLTSREEGTSLEPQLWREAIEQGYPKLREAAALLVREGVNFHDGSRIFVDHPEQIYRDQCHFGRVGCEVFGVFIAKAMIESWPKD